MRLGQLARKYNVSIQEIISCLSEAEPTHDALHSNSKLNEQTLTLVAKHFELLPVGSEHQEEVSEEIPEAIGQKSVEPEVAETEETVEVAQSELDMTLPEAEVQDQQRKDDETIETDRLLELLESEETPIDLSKITLIKAPKKELNGLKVVGKIELADPKSKPVDKSEQQEKEPKSERNSNPQRQQFREEEREKRRLKVKKKNEEYEARKEERRKEKEKKQKKVLRAAHYQKKLQRTKSSQPKHKDSIQREDTSQEVEEQRPEPKTRLGKFWRWMNT